MARIALLGLHALVAVTAIGGAFLVVPAMPLEWLKAGPFDDWTIPAIALGFVGTLAAAAFIAVLIRHPIGAFGSVVAGAAMIVFELVEIGVVGWTLSDPELQGFFQAWLQPIYLVVGSAQLLLGVVLRSVRRTRRTARPIVQATPSHRRTHPSAPSIGGGLT